MSSFQKLRNIISALLMLFYAYLMIQSPKEAYPVILAIMALTLVLTAVNELFYYFSMARFMVGGKICLYKGIIILDFGLFTAMLTDVPSFYIFIYLAAVHAFSGLVEILRANEARVNGGKSWKLKLLHGAVNIIIAILCFVNIKNQETAVIFYSIGLIYSGILKFVSAFRKTTMVYIQ